MENVLITGGNGLIGQQLTKKLREKEFNVSILSRTGKHDQNPAIWYWDPDKGEIDPEAVITADYIIHLSGTNIGEKRWTKNRKKDIIESRTKSAQLIFNTIKKHQGKLKAFISASATGYYGAKTTSQIFKESDPPADDFLGETCRQWEASAIQFESAGIRPVIIRTGIVLTPHGGALAKMAQLVRYGLGSPLGNGRQYLPWIHIDDLCEIYIKAIKDTRMKGAYNAVSPEIPTNRDFYKTLADIIRKPLWLPPVPAFILKIVLGKMAVMLLEGSRVSSGKIIDAGYRFFFPELKSALDDLVQKKR
jgi:uncharacterized protein